MTLVGCYQPPRAAYPSWTTSCPQGTSVRCVIAISQVGRTAISDILQSRRSLGIRSQGTHLNFQGPVSFFYPEVAFGGFTRVDGTIAFYARVDALLTPDSSVLDVGCGRAEYVTDTVPSRRRLRVLRGRCAWVIGIDLDPAASLNPCIDEFRPIESSTWPVDDETIDLCLADNVVEHVEHPPSFLSECRRVLRPGGHLCIRTPNAFGYATLAARIVPNAAHAAVLRTVQPNRESADVFPAFYRCNTPKRLRDGLRDAGFAACVYGHGPEPAYLGFSRVAYALGVAWAGLAPSLVQGTLLAFGQRLP
jgi:SAM-dependent methyltransferase